MADVDRRTMALSLAVDRKLFVIPLKENDYHPVQDNWPEMATRDPLTIDTIWKHRNYNIGVACGHGKLVVDVDDKPGKHGSQSFAQLGLDLSDLDTFTVETPTTGRHYYWEWGDVKNSPGNPKGPLGADIDIKSLGGYVVGPGSYLPDGVKNAQGGYYRIINDRGFKTAPEAITCRLMAPNQRLPNSQMPVVDADQLDEPETVERGIHYLADLPMQVEKHGADHATYKVACTLKDMGLSEQTTLALMWEHYKISPRDHRYANFLERKVDNAYRYGNLPVGAEHPAHVFEGVILPPPVLRPVLVIPNDDKWYRHGDDWQGSIDWLYDEILPTKGVVVLTGPTGSGKTFVELHMAESLATGKSFFGVEPEMTGGTLLAVGEAFNSVKQRMAALARETGEHLPISAIAVGQLADAEAWAELLANIIAESGRIYANFGVPVRLIVLDTLSASGILDDENDNAKASKVLKAFSKLSEHMNALVIIVHHPPKTGGGTRGATAIPNNADYVIEIVRDHGEAIREVQIVKSRDSEERTLGTFSLQKAPIGWNRKGKPVTTMELSTGAPRTERLPYSEKSTLKGRWLLAALDWALQENHGVIALGNKKVIPETIVKKRFFKKLPDDIKKSHNSTRTWRQALEDVLRSGLAEQVDDSEGVACFSRREITLDPPTPPGDGSEPHDCAG